MKVVYNACYGGFSLSREAVLLGRKLSGDLLWGGACIQGDISKSGNVVPEDYGFPSRDIDRHDEILVAVVEQLGEAAGGKYSKLAIKEIPDGAEYEITQYYGYEDVLTPRMSWE